MTVGWVWDGARGWHNKYSACRKVHLINTVNRQHLKRPRAISVKAHRLRVT